MDSAIWGTLTVSAVGISVVSGLAVLLSEAGLTKEEVGGVEL